MHFSNRADIPKEELFKNESSLKKRKKKKPQKDKNRKLFAEDFGNSWCGLFFFVFFPSVVVLGRLFRCNDQRGEAGEGLGNFQELVLEKRERKADMGKQSQLLWDFTPIDRQKERGVVLMKLLRC